MQLSTDLFLIGCDPPLVGKYSDKYCLGFFPHAQVSDVAAATQACKTLLPSIQFKNVKVAPYSGKLCIFKHLLFNKLLSAMIGYLRLFVDSYITSTVVPPAVPYSYYVLLGDGNTFRYLISSLI